MRFNWVDGLSELIIFLVTALALVKFTGELGRVVEAVVLAAIFTRVLYISNIVFGLKFSRKRVREVVKHD